MNDFDMFFRKKLWPICDKCKAPVDEFEFFQSFHDLTYALKARCHGNEETVYIESGFISNLVDAGDNIKSVAFCEAKGLDHE